MKKSILTLVFLSIYLFNFSQRDMEMLRIEGGTYGKFISANSFRYKPINSLHLDINYITTEIKELGSNYVIGLGMGQRKTDIYVPLNNENRELSVSPRYFYLRNGLLFSKLQNLEFSLNLGVAFNESSIALEEGGEFKQNKGVFSELKIGTVLPVRFERRIASRFLVLYCGVSFAAYSFNGSYIPMENEKGLKDVSLKIFNFEPALNIGIGIGFD